MGVMKRLYGHGERISREKYELPERRQAVQPDTTTIPRVGDDPETTTAESGPPLWKQPIEVVGLTGDFASGKTLFALSIAPGPGTLVYDTEKSAGTYRSLGFERIDLSEMMLQKKPGGYNSADLFKAWLAHVKSVPAGKYRVIVLDTVSEIESGLVDYVKANCSQFGLTPNQVTNSAGLLWGAVKDFWKSILSDLSARCETFAFTSHLKSEFRGGRPTGKKVAKGKETLMELASLYLHLEREPDKKGAVPDVPAAIVLKSRLATTSIDDEGNVVILPTLPPRIPVATPKAIRQYMDAPPDYHRLKAAEKLQVHEPTEADLEAMRLARAEAERDSASMELQRVTMTQQAYTSNNTGGATSPVYAPSASNGTAPESQPAARPRPAVATPSQDVAADNPTGATEGQVNQVRFLLRQLVEDNTEPMPEAKAREILDRVLANGKDHAIEVTGKLWKIAKSKNAEIQMPIPDKLKNLLGPVSATGL